MQLIEIVVSQDYTFVTHNARDFRGGGPGKLGGLHAKQELHPGLICLTSCLPMDLDRQRALFGYALTELEQYTDLINQALEVFENVDGMVSIRIYDIPASRE